MTQARETHSPPRRSRRRAARLQPKEREQAILKAAVTVFGRIGVSRAKHKDVAQEAGVAESTVFAYFPNRPELRAAVFRHMERWALDLAEKTLGSGLPADEAIKGHLVGAATLFERQPDEARIWIGWSMAVEDDLWPEYRKLQQRVLALMEDAIRRGQRDGLFDPAIKSEHGALGLLGTAYMVGQTHLEGRSREAIIDFVTTIVDRLRVRAAKPSGT